MSKVRQYFYLAAGLVAGILPILVTFNAISTDQVSAVTQLITGLGSLIGAGGAITAGVVVSKQRKDGTFEPPAEVSPEEAIISNLPTVIDNVAKAVAAKDRVTQAITDVLGDIPVYGKEAQEIVKGLRF